MGAANFQTMRDFSLFARDFSDEIEYYDICDIVQSDLDDVNRDLLFHKITMQSGYYTGVQFYVEAEHDLGEYDYDNEECHYYFDCCRSVAYRKYQSEINKINRKLKYMAKQYGFEELVCTARFSNGAALFSRVNSRTRLYTAV